MRLLATDARVKTYFREAGSFVYLLSALIALAMVDDVPATATDGARCNGWF